MQTLFARKRILEVTEQDRLTNFPFPDVFLLREPWTVEEDPPGHLVRFLVEIYDDVNVLTSADYGVKMELYARAGVAEYRIIDHERDVLTVHHTPVSGDWKFRAVYGANATISPRCLPDAPVRVADWLHSQR